MNDEPVTSANGNLSEDKGKNMATTIWNALKKSAGPLFGSVGTVLILGVISYFFHLRIQYGAIDFHGEEGANGSKSDPAIHQIDSSDKAKAKFMIGRWIDKWYDEGEQHETFNITKVDSSHFWGNVADETDNLRGKWNLEGNYDGSYLQIWYYPTTSEPTAATDKGCYFFAWNQEKQFFKGVWAGHDATSSSAPDQIDTTADILMRVGD